MVKANRMIGLAVVGVLATVALGGETALAKIRCEGRFQIIRGERLSTPYCEDAYLAAVANSYGSRVSAAEIRNNPFKKARICAFVGMDIRVKDICDGHRPEDRLP